ncbi:hypothetical protein [Chryseobacterium sp.]|uniref:hypothetical protein n=1 Tax=Chryseobacterium sp. TaxID=1871047 RepID=UPI00289CB673|nr:hypothetical protein [Chryseobacterium sp.]
MTKADIIKSHYHNEYNRAINSDYGIDENGFSDFYAHHNETHLYAYEIYSTGEMVKVRPLGLGRALCEIDNNNGWIKIENVDDLPVQTVEYHVIKKGLLSRAYYYGNNRWESDENTYPRTTEQHGITHYQPIKYPKPPIY